MALDVAEALAFLHSCGVQHADLKPRWAAEACCALHCSLPCTGLAAWLHFGPYVSALKLPPPVSSPPRSNVMLTVELRAKLTDLGVAQRLGSRSRQAVGSTTQYAGE